MMDEKTLQAYEWAKKQQYRSVAADYARILAAEIDRLTEELEQFKLNQEADEEDLRARIELWEKSFE